MFCLVEEIGWNEMSKKQRKQHKLSKCKIIIIRSNKTLGIREVSILSNPSE